MIEIKNISKISANYDCFFVDLWGVVHNGVKIFEGAGCTLLSKDEKETNLFYYKRSKKVGNY